MKGLIIKEAWIDLILDGRKTWEIRGRQTNKREKIGIIQSGTGTVIGTVDLVDCIALDNGMYTRVGTNTITAQKRLVTSCRTRRHTRGYSQTRCASTSRNRMRIRKAPSFGWIWTKRKPENR